MVRVRGSKGGKKHAPKGQDAQTQKEQTELAEVWAMRKEEVEGEKQKAKEQRKAKRETDPGQGVDQRTAKAPKKHEEAQKKEKEKTEVSNAFNKPVLRGVVRKFTPNRPPMTGGYGCIMGNHDNLDYTFSDRDEWFEVGDRVTFTAVPPRNNPNNPELKAIRIGKVQRKP